MNEFVTREELGIVIDELANSIAEKVQEKLQDKRGILISRPEAIKQIGRTKLNKLIDQGKLIPIRGNGPNGKINFIREDFEGAVKGLTLKPLEITR